MMVLAALQPWGTSSRPVARTDTDPAGPVLAVPSARTSYLSHLECGHCGKERAADQLRNLCPDCQKPLPARYDLPTARRECPREKLSGRPQTPWRYAKMLPVCDPGYRLSQGEGFTPLIHATRLGTGRPRGLHPLGG